MAGGHDDGAAGLHVRYRRSRHEKKSVDICLDRAVEVRLGQLLDPLGVLLEGGIVDQDVELAQLRHGLCHRGLA
jgi:hypothetical protein